MTGGGRCTMMCGHPAAMAAGAVVGGAAAVAATFALFALGLFLLRRSRAVVPREPPANSNS